MSKPVFAVIDCNNFFVSCERVFRPDLADQPVVVLSNNDGCAVSRSNEAKRLGIPMGAPAFKYRELFKREKVTQFSANFSLYGDFSSRVVRLVEKYSPEVEVYSIDECFVRLDSLVNKNYEMHMRQLRAEILKWTGIPVSIGIAHTKTLSKAGVEYAKSHPDTGGVFSFLSKNNKQKDAIMKQILVKDIWGIGRRYSTFLSQFGVKTAHDYMQLSHGWLLQNMKTHGIKVQQELLGRSFFVLEPDKFEQRKTIAATRSFGRDVVAIHELEQAIASHVARASRKLRRQKSVAGKITVFAANSQHRSAPHVHKQAEKKLEVATSYTPQLIDLALELLVSVYQPGVKYYRCGVMLSEIAQQTQLSVFKTESKRANARKTSLMKSFDMLNQKWGDNTIRFGAQGIQQSWGGKSSQRSPEYTRDWLSLPKVNAKH